MTTLVGAVATRTIVFDITGAAFQANFPVGTDQAAPFQGLYTQVLAGALNTKIMADPVVVGPFQPIDLPGLFLWLRGDLGITIGVGVSAWADQSGFGDPNHNEVQAVGVQQPTYIASDPLYNNQATLSFSAAASQFLAAAGAWATALLDPATYFFALNDDGVQVRDFFMSSSIGNGNNFERLAPNVFINNLDQAGTVTTPSILMGLSNGAASKLYVSALTPTVGASGFVGDQGNMWLASNVGADLFQNGKIAEVVIFNRDLTILPAEFTLMTDYLSSRYAITLAP